MPVFRGRNRSQVVRKSMKIQRLYLMGFLISATALEKAEELVWN
jgi:hypothetical protein